MRTFSRVVAATLALAAPVTAQDLGDIVSGVANSLIAQELEANAFREAQRQNTAAAYQDYLAQFPNGAQRRAAERALDDLGGASAIPQPQTRNTSTSAASTEAALGLSRSERTSLQTQLAALGYASGVADGLWGANTRNAIARWQSANNLTATGYVTAQQVGLIERQAGPVDAPRQGSTTATDAAVEERLLDLTRDERREVQRNLTRLGYRTGGADGVFGSGTRRALAAWQEDEGLPGTGYMTADQLRELRRQTGR